MSDSRPCPDCGAALPANSPEGLCPRCLLRRVAAPTEPSPRLEPPPLEKIAAAFPQFEILGLIGQGGMGCVFKARQPKLNRIVALKILPENLSSDATFASRFAREAQTLASLNHPNIVTVHDSGEAGGFFYLLMEYVDGVNVRQALSAGRFTPEQALAIVPPICEALQYAHDQGVVHRDIKPENLLLDKTGRVKIADFGIARMVGAAPIDGEERSMGTPKYVAPEQLTNPLTADHRADIYSLGVVLYELLTGELPSTDFEPPSRKVQVDVRLDDVVLRALEKTPIMRWQTAKEMGTRLEDIRQTVPPPKKFPSPRIPLGGIALLCVPPALFAWFVLPGHQFFGIDIDADEMFWSSLVGFPIVSAFSVVLVWAFKLFPNPALSPNAQGWSVRAIGALLLLALSILLMGGGLGMLALLRHEIGHWNPARGELIFVLVFAVGGILTALSATLLGWSARFSIQRENYQQRGWRPATFAAWFWPGVATILALGSLVPSQPGRPVAAAAAAQMAAIAETKRELANELRFKSLPPVVVQTDPPSGKLDVLPGEYELRVRFSKKMLDSSWSWAVAWSNSVPELTAEPRFEDSRTCTLKAKLEPDRTYAFWLNSATFKNFKDTAGQPAVPYLLIFRTRANEPSR